MADLIVTYQIMGEATVQRGPSLGYVDFVLPPFGKEEYVPDGYCLGPMHVMVRKGGLCSTRAWKPPSKRYLERWSKITWDPRRKVPCEEGVVVDVAGIGHDK